MNISESDREAEGPFLLVSFDEVVDKIGVEQRLDDACDEGGPYYMLPPEKPTSLKNYQ